MKMKWCIIFIPDYVALLHPFIPLSLSNFPLSKSNILQGIIHYIRSNFRGYQYRIFHLESCLPILTTQEEEQDTPEESEVAEEEEEEVEEEEEDEEEDEEELKDPLDELREECAKSHACEPYVHHFHECVERVTAEMEEEDYEHKAYKEDCVEEFFHLQHCINDCAAPKLFYKLK